MPRRAELISTLEKIWHAPDRMRIMDPLPSAHRRGVIAGMLLVIVGILLPSADNGAQPSPGHETSLNLQSPSQPRPVSSNDQMASGIEQQWRIYRIEPGKTLAQLFRDHNLPPTDAYAMAQVEGSGKPLSSLQSGQTIRIRQNASGIVTGLAIDSADGQILFTRQSDSSFIRAR